MVPNPNDGAAVPPQENDEPRYAVLELIEGGLVLYDRENHRAWVQSDDGVDLAAMA